MKDHKPECPRAQAWDHGEWEAPCTCSPDTPCPRCGGPSEADDYAGALLCLKCAGPRYTEQDELERRIAFASANPGADFEALILAEYEDEGLYD